MSITQGAIRGMLSGATPANSTQPILQVTHVKTTKKGKRIMTVSDGTETATMIASTMMPQTVDVGSLAKLTNWKTGINQKGATFIVGNEAVVVGHKPVPAGLAAGAAAAGQQQQQQQQQPPRVPHAQAQRVYGGGGGGATAAATNNMPTIPIKALNP